MWPHPQNPASISTHQCKMTPKVKLIDQFYLIPWLYRWGTLSYYLFKVKSREMTRPLFHVLSITSPWINGKRSISLLHTCGPLFPSTPPNTQGFTLAVDVTQMSYLPVSSKPQYFCFSILGLLTGPIRSIKIRSNTFEWARTTKFIISRASWP